MTDETSETPTIEQASDVFQQMMDSHQQVRDRLGIGGSGPLSIEEMIEGQTDAAKTAIIAALRDLSGTREGTDWEARWYKGGQTHKRDLPSFAHHTISNECWSEESARDLALSAWAMPEWPEQIGRDEWDEIFGAVGDLPLTDGDDVSVPTGHVQVWRGSYEDHKAGLAWTTDPHTAAWFAARANRPGDEDRRARVWTTTVDPERVYAFLDGRNEHEVVCAVEGLPITEDPAHSPPENATGYDQSQRQFWVACDSCGDRHYGHRGAAGLLLRFTPEGSEPQVWLARRARGTDHSGKWAFPSGAREDSEEATQAALREFTEETGFGTSALPSPTEVLVDDHEGWTFTTVIVDVDEATALAVDRAVDGDGESADGAWWPIDEAHELDLLGPVADLLTDLHGRASGYDAE